MPRRDQMRCSARSLIAQVFSSTTSAPSWVCVTWQPWLASTDSTICAQAWSHWGLECMHVWRQAANVHACELSHCKRVSGQHLRIA